MKKSLMMAFVMLILLLSANLYADEHIKLPSRNKDLGISVLQSDIDSNLANYRANANINLTLAYYFITKEASQEYKSGVYCPLPASSNDYRYILQTINFRFANMGGFIISEYGYDKYDNLICGSESKSYFDANKSYFGPILNRLKKAFEEADRLDKAEPW